MRQPTESMAKSNNLPYIIYYNKTTTILYSIYTNRVILQLNTQFTSTEVGKETWWDEDKM